MIPAAAIAFLLRVGLRRAVLLLSVFPLFSSCSAQEEQAAGGEKHVIGVYTSFRVIDGDTFRIEGLKRGVRFLFIDTEEVPRGDDAIQDLAQLRAAWPQPYYAKRGDGSFPVKMASPMGWDTSEWAKEWFSDVDSIRLERDSRKNVYGYFGRWLALVFARKNGTWVLYNLECVRQGHSPYYGKYGFSERFHDEFKAAQREARAAQRGIWNPSLQHYPDYDERMTWWDGRGEAVTRYLAGAGNEPGQFFMGRDGEFERLALHAGEDVVVFGAVDWIDDDQPVTSIRLPHKEKQAVIVRLPASPSASWIREHEQQYVYARGRLIGGGKEMYLDIENVGAISRRPLR